MTQPKKVAQTLKNILENNIMIQIMDKSKPIEQETIDEVLSWWKYDLFSRKPGPAYDEDGVFQGTDLDLACFLYELADRNAVVNLPTYKSIRPRTITEGQFIISDKNRHGSILGISANDNTFLFSIKIKDMNVIKTDTVGEFRNFTITDFDGSMYSGWDKIAFLPTAKENQFLLESKILTENKIIFHNFSHPNRWISFFGQYYFITKCLINRLVSESSYYFQGVKTMLSEGIVFPETDSDQEEWPNKEREKGKSVKVNSFQVEVDIPEVGEFPKIEHNQENLVKCSKLRKYYTYKVVPKLRFAARATELSFYNKKSNDIMPSWLEDVKWEKDYSVPGKRIKWDRLCLFQPGVGKRSVAIRKRTYLKSETVANEYVPKTDT